MAGIPSNPADRKAIFECMKEISNSMARMEGEAQIAAANAPKPVPPKG